LITLEKELAFSHAYFNLLKTRFGEGLKLEISINPAFRLYLVPPITLQLLIENAVKHNVASLSKPLIIQIGSTEPATLTVSNNLQKKPKSADTSSKKGLLNITSKYRLLGYTEVLITQNEDTFEVKIPLINPVSHENSHH
jgi:LytS/YehU family sensor histidine kinase